MRKARYECAHANINIMEKTKKNSPKSRIMTLTIKAVVFNQDNEILLLKRDSNSKFSAGKYDLPGGHIEENESLKDSVLREIKEETGLKTVFGEIIDVVEFPENSQMFKDEKRGIRAICYSDSKEVELSVEHEEYLWLPTKKALEKLSTKDGFENEKRETIIKAQKYLEMKSSLEGWKRCMADFENYKKRQAEDRKDMIAFSNTNLILEILPILDNFYASTEFVPEDQKENQWVIGIMHIQKQLEKVLEDNGVIEISVKAGDEFDPNIMEAVESDSKDKKKSGDKVEKVLIRGYKMGGKVIRATKVSVK